MHKFGCVSFLTEVKKHSLTMLLLKEREVISLTHLRPPTPTPGKKHLASGHSFGHHFYFLTLFLENFQRCEET